MHRTNQQGHAAEMSAPVIVLKVLRLVRAGLWRLVWMLAGGHLRQDGGRVSVCALCSSSFTKASHRSAISAARRRPLSTRGKTRSSLGATRANKPAAAQSGPHCACCDIAGDPAA
jgi:hypothetical protein